MKAAYRIKCKGCQKILSQKTQKIYVVSNSSIHGFSTNIQTDLIQLAYDQKQFQFCQCKTRDTQCKNCYTKCGYYVAQPCAFCMSKPNNGHFWIFTNVNGQPTNKVWRKYQQKFAVGEIDFYTFLQQNNIPKQTIQILQKEKLSSFEKIKQLNDENLKTKGIDQNSIQLLKMMFD